MKNILKKTLLIIVVLFVAIQIIMDLNSMYSLITHWFEYETTVDPNDFQYNEKKLSALENLMPVSEYGKPSILSNTEFFWIIFFTIITSAIMIILSKNPVYSVFFLMIVFIIAALMIFTMRTDFFAILILIIYVGAIIVLFLFVVMMLNIRIIELRESIISYIPIAIFTIILLSSIVWNKIIKRTYFILTESQIVIKEKWQITEIPIGTTANALWDTYPFVITLAGLILFVSMVGSIILVMKYKKQDSKAQDYYKQINQNIYKSTTLIDLKKHKYKKKP